MSQIQFPVNFKFKISTFASDFSATNAQGNMIAYVRQKMFKFKEDIQVFSDESKTQELFRIKADRYLDFSAAYNFTYTPNGDQYLGKIARKGWRSMWSAHYDIIDQNDQPQFTVQEDNAWIKVIDSLLGQLPLVGLFSNYLFNPSYSVVKVDGTEVAQIKKRPSLLGREFEVSKLNEIDKDDEQRVLLGLMMMILLERRRG